MHNAGAVTLQKIQTAIEVPDPQLAILVRRQSGDIAIA
jgi:hypothetical protein